MEYGNNKGEIRSDKEFDTTVEDGASHLKSANIFYVCFFIVFSIIMFLLYNTGSSWLGKIINTEYTEPRDIGSQLVSRTSFSLALWFLIHSLVTIGNTDFTESGRFFFHVSYYWVHVLVYLGMWVACWFIPDPLFTVFLKIAMYLSFVYIILQLFFLMDFFIQLNEKFTEGDSIKLPLSITVVLSLTALGVLGVDYYLFGMKGCGGNIAIITVNLVLVVILFFVSLGVTHGSILTSSLVSIYIAFLTTVGLFCEGGSGCNRLSSSTSNIWLTILASLFTICWACSSAFSSVNNYQLLDCGSDCLTCECCGEKTEEAKNFSLSFFHFMFFGASIYISMVVTSWASSDHNSAPWSVDRGYVAKWVNIAASWVCILIYASSLMAPYICSDREFSR